jgi:DNA-directed RNA polymerase subunit H (RpoH/RPB5)
MTEARLKQLQEIITAKKVVLDLDEARKLAKRASAFKQERGRLPSITAADPWEKRMAEGLAFLTRKAKEEQRG